MGILLTTTVYLLGFWLGMGAAICAGAGDRKAIPILFAAGALFVAVALAIVP